MGRFLWRAAIITHRYLGVLAGLLMLVWFLSGIVMMYVGFPQIAREDRLRTLSPISWQRCCAFAGERFSDDQPIAALQVENLTGEPAMRVRPEGQPQRLYSLGTAQAVDLDEARARAIAIETAAKILGRALEPLSADTIEYDQWTVGNYRPLRPLYRFAFGDPERTTLYVSGVTGEAVLWTTATQRFWNWLGAIPHWLYPTMLRSQVELWSQIVIWGSILGGFLTLLGLYLGIAQIKTTRTSRISPYRGWYYWHHVTGLFFGVVTLTWVISGTISMNPWGFLEGSGGDERTLVVGEPQNWAAVRESLGSIQANPPSGDIVSLSLAPYAGKLFWLASRADGSFRRLDAAGAPAQLRLEDLQAAASRVAAGTAIASEGMIAAEDTYYFAHHNKIVLPAYRVILSNADATRYYFDPSSGALLGRADATARAHRWLFDGLHRLDFASWLRARPVWDIVMVFLLLGGTAGSATGVYLAIVRIRRDLTFVPGPRARL